VSSLTAMAFHLVPDGVSQLRKPLLPTRLRNWTKPHEQAKSPNCATSLWIGLCAIGGAT
jgi:hypothetical protein